MQTPAVDVRGFLLASKLELELVLVLSRNTRRTHVGDIGMTISPGIGRFLNRFFGN